MKPAILVCHKCSAFSLRQAPVGEMILPMIEPYYCPAQILGSMWSINDVPDGCDKKLEHAVAYGMENRDDQRS